MRLMTDRSAVLAYSGYITGSPSSEFIQCLDDCEGVEISLKTFESLRSINNRIDLMFRYLAEQHYLSLERRLFMLHHKTAKERYQYFCQVMEEKIVLSTPNQSVASYLGVTPESFSRVKRHLTNC